MATTGGPVNKPTGSEIRLASPLKAWASRFALLLLGARTGMFLLQEEEPPPPLSSTRIRAGCPHP